VLVRVMSQGCGAPVAAIDAAENAIRQAQTDARARPAPSSFLAENAAPAGLTN
jgi:hypothetical protein